MAAVLDESISYQMVWVSAPLTLVLFAIGLVVWFAFARCAYCSRARYRWENTAVLVLFTMNIIWLYTNQAVGHMDGRRALSYRGLGAQVAGTDYKRSPASAGPPTTRSSASRAGISYCFSVVGPVARAQCIEGARRFLQTVALVVAAFYVFPVIAVFVFNYFTTVEQVPGAELCQYRSVYL